MPIDFGKISRSKVAKRPIHPIELFQSLKVTDRDINDLWLAQGDALRQWHSNRDLNDIAIVLNTGAGKTLVGLLAAQSLVNETNGHVVYVCSSIQLIEQTASKARGYGLQVTTYFRQQFSDDLYQRGLAPCITTYQALFNGKSRFFRDDINAVVFDDAHTAEHLLREQFTLRINRGKHPQLFSQIVQLFRTYYTRIALDVGYMETQQGQDPATSWFVPPFALREQLGELKRLLLSADLSRRQDTMFPWEHLKDHMDLCTVFVSGQDIFLTPPIVPVGICPHFQKRIRRLYLSATLAAKDGFLRTFGKVPETIIAPETTAGECERLIIIPSLRDDCDDDVRVAKRIIADRKALILVPSYRRANQWRDIVVGKQDDVGEQLENFKNSQAPAKLLLASRYDGVDLPGNTCRVMIIDDLPSSVGPLERYLWEQLGLAKGLQSTVASRIVQSFGRISRGMSDHGVVLLTGKKLVEWLLTPRNRSALPPFLRRQLELGIDVSKQANSLSDLIEAASQCLERDPGWINYYQDYMGETAAIDDFAHDGGIYSLAEVESDFGYLLWSRDYAGAAKHIEQTLEKTFEISRNIGAWHALWLGYCYELMGDTGIAHELYRRAYSVAKNIPPFDLQTPLPPDQQPCPQILEVARYLHGGPQIRRHVLGKFDSGLAVLDGTGSPSQTAEALRSLGEYLGLAASRPDNEFGTGPDVFWEMPGGPALSLEAKTEKDPRSCYRKKDLGQLRDHAQWCLDHSQATTIFSAFVGPVVPASHDSNPDPDMMVIELEEFQAVAERLRAALEDVCSMAVPNTLGQVVLHVFQQRKLIWPNLYEHIKKHPLRDIRHRE